MRAIIRSLESGLARARAIAGLKRDGLQRRRLVAATASHRVTPPLLFANLAWRALSGCRRTSVRPPDDTEKSVAHRLHCAMPLSGNFAIQAPPILVKLAFSLRRHFFQRGLRHLVSREYGKQRAQMIGGTRLSNGNPPPLARHGSSVDAACGVKNKQRSLVMGWLPCAKYKQRMSACEV